ncbi:class III lanthionine synthetase LanKC [Nonomuraea angiospora]|uniref:class III lanthionine synthetase LanKC n=1 Tax=Nonomuraea angiospora TaxID=46172 RepID=UPI003441BE6E
MAITDFVPSAKDFVPYCVADPLVFDTPAALPDTTGWFASALQPAPAGWIRSVTGLNISMRPGDAVLPEQGWKIHISATVSDAARAIDIVWDHCIGNGLAFKFLRSPAAVTTVNSKYWPRSSSGKLITLYPRDHEQFAKAVHSLASALDGIRGPYILSDLRYSDSPLFIRYGAFVPLWCVSEDGTPRAAIRDPDGTLRPDIRTPVFTVPEFVTVPAEFEPGLRDARRSMDGFPFEIESALHFSNAGGVYLGRARDSGERVVLREARPYAGLDGNGDDAVTRLWNEHAALTRLRGLACVPQVIDCLQVWEHWFLVTNHVDGAPLLNQIIHRYPLVHANPSDADIEAYTAWVEGIVGKLREVVAAIHGRGLAVGDLHPSNVIVTSQDDVVLVDFENAYDIAGGRRPGLGAQGFAASHELSPAEADLEGVERIQLMALLPVVPVVALDRDKTVTLQNVADDQLHPSTSRPPPSSRPSGPRMGKDRCAEIFNGLGETWTTARDSLIAGITAAATLERADRLFPGDPLQFTFGGASLAYGAAGVLLAMARAGALIEPDHLAWLQAAAFDGHGCRGLGLYDGSYGAAYALHLAGAREAALELVDRATWGPIPQACGLFGGRAGVALALLHFGRVAGEPRWEAAGHRLGDGLKNAVLGGAELRDARPGLLHGASGPALVFLRLHEMTGEQDYLRAARLALGSDLRTGALMADGAYHIAVGTRYLAYLDGGSAGVGLVLLRYLAAKDDPEFRVILDGIVQACQIPFVMQPGLFQGRAGMIALLGALSADLREEAVAQARRLAWHAVSYRGGIAFPGRGLHRLSFDLGTGSAGVLLMLGGVMGGGGVPLPFLGGSDGPSE